MSIHKVKQNIINWKCIQSTQMSPSCPVLNFFANQTHTQCPFQSLTPPLAKTLGPESKQEVAPFIFTCRRVDMEHSVSKYQSLIRLGESTGPCWLHQSSDFFSPEGPHTKSFDYSYKIKISNTICTEHCCLFFECD